MIRLAAVLVAFLARAALNGCGTIVALGENGNPYGGVVLDGTVVARGVPQGVPLPGKDFDIPQLWPLALLDLPLSLAGDTVLLPFTVPYWLLRGVGQPAASGQQQPECRYVIDPPSPTTPDRVSGGIGPGY